MRFGKNTNLKGDKGSQGLFFLFPFVCLNFTVVLYKMVKFISAVGDVASKKY